MGWLNIEIKAKCKNLKNIRDILITKGAEFKGTDHQIDTYFRVTTGRLKLREGTIENALIYYHRKDITAPKASKIILYKTSPGSALKEILTESLGVIAVVDKLREIYFIKNIKFHLDTVKHLGTFMEIEAIDKDGTIGEKKLRQQCESYLQLFNVEEPDLIAGSYSDLLSRYVHLQ